MTEQNTPMLSLSLDVPDPVVPAAEPVQSIQEPVAAPAVQEEKEPVRLDKSQLTEAERPPLKSSSARWT